MNKFDKKPLYRKVNTKVHGLHHNYGEDYKRVKPSSKMVKKDRGLDYTPLYRFLISKVGSNWDDVYSEAVSRLDKHHFITYGNPIFHIVSSESENEVGYSRTGESSYYSLLFIDENNILQKVDPSLNETSLEPVCKCCTHTFNGVKFSKAYKE